MKLYWNAIWRMAIYGALFSGIVSVMVISIFTTEDANHAFAFAGIGLGVGAIIGMAMAFFTDWYYGHIYDIEEYHKKMTTLAGILMGIITILTLVIATIQGFDISNARAIMFAGGYIAISVYSSRYFIDWYIHEYFFPIIKEF